MRWCTWQKPTLRGSNFGFWFLSFIKIRAPIRGLLSKPAKFFITFVIQESKLPLLSLNEGTLFKFNLMGNMHTNLFKEHIHQTPKTVNPVNMDLTLSFFAAFFTSISSRARARRASRAASSCSLKGQALGIPGSFSILGFLLPTNFLASFAFFLWCSFTFFRILYFFLKGIRLDLLSTPTNPTSSSQNKQKDAQIPQPGAIKNLQFTYIPFLVGKWRHTLAALHHLGSLLSPTEGVPSWRNRVAQGQQEDDGREKQSEQGSKQGEP